MNSKDWSLLKSELISRGFNIQVKGRDKREYLGFNEFMSIDIFRGSTGTPSGQLTMYVFDSNQNIVCEINDSDYRILVSAIDTIIEGYHEFGDLLY